MGVIFSVVNYIISLAYRLGLFTRRSIDYIVWARLIEYKYCSVNIHDRLHGRHMPPLLGSGPFKPFYLFIRNQISQKRKINPRTVRSFLLR